MKSKENEIRTVSPIIANNQGMQKFYVPKSTREHLDSRYLRRIFFRSSGTSYRNVEDKPVPLYFACGVESDYGNVCIKS